METPPAYWTAPRRVFLLWAVIVTGGFVATQYYQFSRINWLWLVMTVIGLGYMLKKMPMRNETLRNIFLVWLIVLSLGMAISILSFRIVSLAFLAGYLGVFWLALMGLGHIATGLVSKPSKLFFFNGAVLLASALICYYVPAALTYQYLAAAAVGGGTMVLLILF